MQRIDCGVIYWRIWWRGGSLLEEATAKDYKKQSAKSELLEVGYSGVSPWLKGARVAKWGEIPGGTVLSQDLRGHKKNRVPEGQRARRHRSWEAS